MERFELLNYWGWGMEHNALEMDFAEEIEEELQMQMVVEPRKMNYLVTKMDCTVASVSCLEMFEG